MTGVREESAEPPPEVDDSTLIAQRAAPVRPVPTDDLPDPDLDADTGSTMVVRRESRRRAEAAARYGLEDLDATVEGTGAQPLPATVAGDVPAPLGRVAHAPAPPDRVYDVRVSGPVIAPRAPSAPTVPQQPVDGAALDAAARRRARRRALIVVVAASVVVFVAAAALIALVFGA